ncbi:ciliogenesis-associated TTC17-interacting protein [Harmonia axyridis]|uniref:ciliogenesis-associated TTC17-interacting protein n=1 Tax=Harmonia axyridis TaxID=115357 RepID=UPI001E27533F|nr:ciliogenesis-associated TTC17-interacting protein [Harmonia axyridis]
MDQPEKVEDMLETPAEENLEVKNAVDDMLEKIEETSEKIEDTEEGNEKTDEGSEKIDEGSERIDENGEKIDEESEKMGEGDEKIDYHDQVLEYLMNQEQYVPEEDHYPELEPKEVVEKTAKDVLSQLLTDVDNITSFKEAYAEKKQLNNQFELFDLTKIIPNFHIDDKVMEMMAFRETLLISKVDSKGQAEPVGGFCLDVQAANGEQWDKSRKSPDFTTALLNACNDIKKRYKEDVENEAKKDLEEYSKFLEEEMKKYHKKFLIHLSTQFNVDGKNAGSRLTAWADKNLHTLEEKRTEYIMTTRNEEQILDQKQLYIYIGKKHFDVRVVPSKDLCKKYCYSFRRAQNFIGEAVNFILLRYLAITKFIGEFELSAIHIDGGLCRNIYQCEGPMGGFINNEKIDVYKVYRTIVEECGIVQRSCTLLSLDGRIMKHDWEKCDYVLQINPILSPQEKTATMVLHFDEIWKYDLQLFSKYLDKKLAASSHMKSYLYDHKEIGSLINDYVQNILQIKPENIIQFTKHYFLSYAPYLLPRAEYFEQDVNKCFYNEENSNNDNMNI